MNTAEKIRVIESSELSIAYDGCHKLYILENDNEVEDARYTGYMIYPASDVRKLVLESCGLVFINLWDVTGQGKHRDWEIVQGTEDIFTAAKTKATYHGITFAKCHVCKYESRDITELECWNDYGSQCPMANSGESDSHGVGSVTEWHVNGQITYTIVTADDIAHVVIGPVS